MQRRFLSIWLVSLLTLCNVYAQNSHWQCDIRSFQYDMTLYAELSLDGTTIVQEGYEVAAFCGEECRGVATVETIEGKEEAYYYLRIRSNVVEGEKIIIKCFHGATQKEMALSETIDFVSQSIHGYPSKPLVLTNASSPLIGDVNGDGDINIADAIGIVNYVLKQEMGTFVASAADMNGDGDINIADAIAIVNMILKK